MTGEGLRVLIQDLVGNIFLAVLGAAAIVFLFQRRFTEMAQFAVIAVLVATFIYTPELWTGMGQAVAGAFGTGGG
jgi:hypothetical protein